MFCDVAPNMMTEFDEKQGLKLLPSLTVGLSVLCNNDMYFEGNGNLESIQLNNLWEHKSKPTASVSNLRIDNVEDVGVDISRLMPSDPSEWICCVDLTNPLQSRNLRGLLQLQEKHDFLHFSFSTSPNLESPPRSAKRMVDVMSKELLVGVEVSPLKYLRAGSIFCQMGGNPITGALEKVQQSELPMLEACAQLHVQFREECQAALPPIIVGAGPLCSCHMEIVKILAEFGAEMSKVVLCQLNVCSKSLEAFHHLLTSFPVSICVDGFGAASAFAMDLPTDDDIIETVVQLCQRGHTSQIVLSVYLRAKIQLRKYGGPGLALLQDRIIPRLGDKIAAEDVGALVSINLFKLLHWYRRPVVVELPVDMLECYVCLKQFTPGDHFTKFDFVYCSTGCLVEHRRGKWARRT